MSVCLAVWTPSRLAWLCWYLHVHTCSRSLLRVIALRLRLSWCFALEYCCCSDSLLGTVGNIFVNWSRKNPREMTGRRPLVRYAAVSSREDLGKDGLRSGNTTEAEEDLRFKYEVPDEVPFKSIALALFLLSLGCFFLLISHFIFTKHMAGDASQAYGFLFLGFIVFVPGFYETRIAYYSWRGFHGYSFSRIPTY